MDDLKSSHIDQKVNNEFDACLQKHYGTHGAVTIHCGKVHQYLGMELDYLHRGEVKIGMVKYVQGMLDKFATHIKEE